MKKYFRFFLIACVCFTAGVIAHRYKGDVLDYFNTPEEIVSESGELIKLEDLHFDTLSLKISNKNYEILANNRATAIEKGTLLKEFRDKVKAKLIVNSDTLKVDLRLKGDRPDHWNHENKWSFRIEVKKGKAYNGMRIFNVQRPKTRGNMNEWLFHRFLNSQNLLTIRYYFVHMRVNGDDLGIYAVEEFFDKRLIENNQARAGLVFKVNTSKYWYNKKGYISQMEGSPISPFKIGAKDRSNPLYSQFMTAQELMKGYFSKQYSLDKVFDVPKLAKFMATVDLMGHQHASYLDNLKFYYNPITALIEPIGYDNSVITDIKGDFILPTRKLIGERREVIESDMELSVEAINWYGQIFSSKIFHKEYIKALNDISDPVFMQDFKMNNSRDIAGNVLILQQNDPNFKFEDFDILVSNAAFIQNYLHPIDALQFYASKFALDSITMEVVNCHKAAFQIKELVYKDSVIYSFNKGNIVQPAGLARSSTIHSIYIDTAFVSVKKLLKNLHVNYETFGISNKLSSEVFNWSYIDSAGVGELIKARTQNVESFDFIVSTDSGWVIPKGDWIFDRTLIVGDDTKLIIEPGAHIILRHGACILSYSSVNAVGRVNDHIVIKGEKGGRGLLVLNAKLESIITYVDVTETSNFKIGSWELSGSINFYQSDVKLDQVRFRNNLQGDDFLNIVRSKFELKNSSFYKSFADAFDGDFVEGSVRNVSFDSIGNDGLDFSGSIVGVNNAEFNNIEDKAISAGERTSIACSKVSISNAELAFTSKDDSNIKISDSKVSNSKVAFVIFSKKPEFGEATIYALSTEIESCDLKYLVEVKSTLILDSKKVEDYELDVSSMLYGQQYGKSSK